MHVGTYRGVLSMAGFHCIESRLSDWGVRCLSWAGGCLRRFGGHENYSVGCGEVSTAGWWVQREFVVVVWERPAD